MLLLIAQVSGAKPTAKAVAKPSTTPKSSDDNDDEDDGNSRSGTDDAEDYLDEEEKPKETHHHHLHVHTKEGSKKDGAPRAGLIGVLPPPPPPPTTTKAPTTSKPEEHIDNDDADSSDDYSDEGEYRTTVKPGCSKTSAAPPSPRPITTRSPRTTYKPMMVEKPGFKTVVSTTKSPAPKKSNITIKPLTSTTKPITPL